MKSDCRKDRGLTVTERPSDFSPRRSTVLATGCSSCCCCCCLWSAGAAVGAATGFGLARRMGKHAYRDMPHCIRRGFWRWGAVAALVVLLAPQIFTLGQGRDGFLVYLMIVAIFLPLLLIPFSVGGLIGAYRARRFLPRMGTGRAPEARGRRSPGAAEGDVPSPAEHEKPEADVQAEGPDKISMRPVWRVVGFMWLGAIIGLVVGILIFIPIAATW